MSPEMGDCDRGLAVANGSLSLKNSPYHAPFSKYKYSTMWCNFQKFGAAGSGPGGRLLYCSRTLRLYIVWKFYSVTFCQSAWRGAAWQLGSCRCPETSSILYVNVTDTISWRGHHDRVMQLNWLHFFYICGTCTILIYETDYNLLLVISGPGVNRKA
jgi:hypothetical protein